MTRGGRERQFSVTRGPEVSPQGHHAEYVVPTEAQNEAREAQNRAREAQTEAQEAQNGTKVRRTFVYLEPEKLKMGPGMPKMKPGRLKMEPGRPKLEPRMAYRCSRAVSRSGCATVQPVLETLFRVFGPILGYWGTGLPWRQFSLEARWKQVCPKYIPLETGLSADTDKLS